MRQLLELEASREALPSVNHDFGFLLLLAPRHVSRVLNLLSRWEDLSRHVTGVASVLWRHETVWFVNFSSHLDQQGLLLELLNLQQLFIDGDAHLLHLRDRVWHDFGDLLLIEGEQLVRCVEAIAGLRAAKLCQRWLGRGT